MVEVGGQLGWKPGPPSVFTAQCAVARFAEKRKARASPGAVPDTCLRKGPCRWRLLEIELVAAFSGTAALGVPAFTGDRATVVRLSRRIERFALGMSAGHPPVGSVGGQGTGDRGRPLASAAAPNTKDQSQIPCVGRAA
jgi:hypothetical protein